MPPTQSTTRAGVVQLAAAKLGQIDAAKKRLSTMWDEHAELMQQMDGEDFAEYRRRIVSVDPTVQAEAISGVGGGIIPAPDPLDVEAAEQHGDADEFGRFWRDDADDSGVLAWIREHLHVAS